MQGNLTCPADDMAVIGGRVQRYPYLDAHMAVHLALAERDLSPRTSSNRTDLKP